MFEFLQFFQGVRVKLNLQAKLALHVTRAATSRSQRDRVLDPRNLSTQLDTLIKAASAVSRTVEIRLKRETQRTRVPAA